MSVKAIRDKQLKKKILFHFLISCAMGWIFFSLSLLGLTKLISLVLIRAVFVVGMVSMGCFSVQSFFKLFNNHGVFHNRIALMYASFMALALLTGNFILSRFFDKISLSELPAGAAGFLLPFVLHYCWAYINSIDQRASPPQWYLPSELPEQKVSLFSNSLRIKLKVKSNFNDETEESYILEVPSRITVGEMFQRFATNPQSGDMVIQLSQQNLPAFGWRFILKRIMGDILLDPFCSLVQLGLTRDDVVVAERVY